MVLFLIATSIPGLDETFTEHNGDGSSFVIDRGPHAVTLPVTNRRLNKDPRRRVARPETGPLTKSRSWREVNNESKEEQRRKNRGGWIGRPGPETSPELEPGTKFDPAAETSACTYRKLPQVSFSGNVSRNGRIRFDLSIQSSNRKSLRGLLIRRRACVTSGGLSGVLVLTRRQVAAGESGDIAADVEGYPSRPVFNLDLLTCDVITEFDVTPHVTVTRNNFRPFILLDIVAVIQSRAIRPSRDISAYSNNVFFEISSSSFAIAGGEGGRTPESESRGGGINSGSPEERTERVNDDHLSSAASLPADKIKLFPTIDFPILQNYLGGGPFRSGPVGPRAEPRGVSGVSSVVPCPDGMRRRRRRGGGGGGVFARADGSARNAAEHTSGGYCKTPERVERHFESTKTLKITADLFASIFVSGSPRCYKLAPESNLPRTILPKYFACTEISYSVRLIRQ